MKFLLLFFLFVLSLASQAATMAITVMLTADEETKDWAAEVNREIYRTYPQGYKFDDSHLSHISLYQTYVEISCFDEKWDDIEKEMKAGRILGLKLSAKSLVSAPMSPSSELSEVSVPYSGDQKLTALQKKLRDILKTCRSEVENPKAFYGSVQSNTELLSSVREFDLKQTENSFTPKMALGVLKTSDAVTISKKHTAPTQFIIKRIGIFRLGAFGTARERLYSLD